jgi:hypothetical protein
MSWGDCTCENRYSLAEKEGQILRLRGASRGLNMKLHQPSVTTAHSAVNGSGSILTVANGKKQQVFQDKARRFLQAV